MKKDIFIDNNIACRFTNPMDPEFVKLIKWLLSDGEVEEERAYLTVSQKLLNEYYSSCREAISSTAIPVIVETLPREGRLSWMTKDQISSFKNEHFSKTVMRKLQSNIEDWDHIPVVLLSDRKMALTSDRGLAHDLRSFPGYTVRVSNRPEELPYR